MKVSDIIKSKAFVTHVLGYKIIWNHNKKHDMNKRVSSRTTCSNFNSLSTRVFEKVIDDSSISTGIYVLNLTKSNFKFIMMINRQDKTIFIHTILSSSMKTKDSDTIIDVNEVKQFFGIEVTNGVYFDTLLVEQNDDDIFSSYVLNEVLNVNLFNWSL